MFSVFAMKKRACVVQFLGSNCDDEGVRAIQTAGFEVEKIFYTNGLDENAKYDLIFIPGGFSYGDYLRTGVMAARSKIMDDVAKRAAQGVSVVGVCNGFQILAECGLVDGVLMKNSGGQFICKNIYLKTHENSANKIFANLSSINKAQIAHGEGLYYNTPDKIKQLQDENKIAFYYCNAEGEIASESNPNGSLFNIAGVFGGKNNNVIGMMPHPERMVETGLSKQFFECFL